ncbi:MAG: hypothetical protein PUE01_14315 [Clostridiaceae bacterium]|nr:hypothetical protein [Clostridiaceae bacterium]
MKKDERKKSVGSIIAFLSFILLGGACGFLSGIILNKGNNQSDDIVMNLINLIIAITILYLAAFLQIIIHEGGHLIFGLISGYKFLSFRIGSFMLVRKKNKLQLKRFSLMGTGGQCLMDPPEEKEGSFPYMLYNLGGILNNFIFSVIAIIFALLLNDFYYFSTFLVAFSLIGVAFTLMNGIPLHVGPIDNDGYNALNLGRNNEARKCFWIQMKINALISNGIRLKEISDDLFVIPKAENMNNGLCAAQRAMVCSRAMDKMDFEKAVEIGQAIINDPGEIIPIHKWMVISDMIYCELIGENRKEKIAELYNSKGMKKFFRSFKNYPAVIRMKYAYELLNNNDLDKAEILLKHFNKISKTYPHECEIEGERELIEYAREIYNKKEVTSV